MTEQGRDHFSNPPQRRVGALGIVRDPQGRVLFVQKENPPQDHPAPFYIPGGCVEENEPVLEGLVRVARAELGVELKPGRLLAVHHMYEKQHATHLSKEGYNFLFDCGVLGEEPEWTLAEGIARAAWLAPEEFREHLMVFTVARVEAALRALVGDDVEVLHNH